MKKPAIEFEGVWKSYPMYHHMTGGLKNFLFNLRGSMGRMRSARFDALREIDLKVAPGETLGVIGRNGAGKSSLLGLIAGVLKPSRGRVTVRGRVAPLLELGAGFHPELTGRENIVLNGVLMGVSRSRVRKEAANIIEFSGLERFIGQPLRTYSTGMLTRLGFSVAVHLDPEILLIDEALTVGDVSFQKRCLERIVEFKEQGVTIVFVSHMLEDIVRTCDRAVWIDRHAVRADGGPVEVVSEYLRSLGPEEALMDHPAERLL